MKTTNILIVEDAPLIAADLSEKLRSLGFGVLAIASSAEEAFLVAEAARPDTVLMDIDLDGPVDGIEAARRIYAELRIPIIFVTAHADTKTLLRAQDADPFGYITKPVSVVGLTNAIEVGLRRYHKQDAHQVREAWLEAQLNSVGEGLIAASHDGIVRFINEEGSRLLGVSPLDVVGKPFNLAVPLRRRGTWLAPPNLIRLALLQGATMNIGEDYELDRLGNRKIAGEIAISRFHGETIGVVFSFRDNTVQQYRRNSLSNSIVKAGSLDCSRQPVNLYHACRDMESGLREKLSPAITLSVAEEEPTQPIHLISANQNLLAVILTELVARAEQNLGNGGNVHVSAANLDFEQRESGGTARYVRLRIECQGNGMPSKSYSVQQLRLNGLSIDSGMARVQSALQALRATAQEESLPGCTRWDIDFPAAIATPATADGDSHPALVVLIEPLADVRSSLADFLTDESVECIGARDVEGALNWDPGFPIDVIILSESDYASNSRLLRNESAAASILLVTESNKPAAHLLFEDNGLPNAVVDHRFSQELLRDKLGQLLQSRAEQRELQARKTLVPLTIS